MREFGCVEALVGGFDLEASLGQAFTQFGPWAYVMVFVAVAFQTANPVGAAVPGNPLLFLVGLLAKTTEGVSLPVLWTILCCAAFLGNLVGYGTGKWSGPKIFKIQKFAEQEEKMRNFFGRHGSKAVVLAFFIPFVRCFLPIFAGFSKMPVGAFVLGSLLGALSWVSVFLWAGYAFGEIPAVRQNLEIAILAIGVLVVGRIAFAARSRKVHAASAE